MKGRAIEGVMDVDADEGSQTPDYLDQEVMFSEDLNKLVNRYITDEFDLSVMQIIGMLTTKAHALMRQ